MRNYSTAKINGRIVQYHNADQINSTAEYPPDVWQLLGIGVIHSIGRILQPGYTRLAFYRLRGNRPRFAR